MNETNRVRLIMQALSKAGARVFRNNVGVGWQGRQLRAMQPGVIVLAEPRPLHAGLCEGSSDIIGWTRITVTPDMVGKQIAVFTAVEVKTDRGRPTPAQRNFIERVQEAGGFAGVVRSPEEAIHIIHDSGS